MTTPTLFLCCTVIKHDAGFGCVCFKLIMPQSADFCTEIFKLKYEFIWVVLTMENVIGKRVLYLLVCI